MSASLTLRFGMAAAAFSCLVAGSVVAQQQGTSGARSSQSASDASADQGVGQSDRASAQQSGQSAIRDSDAAAPASQRYTANFRGESARGGDNKVEKYIAGCLLAKNKAEIELSQFAAQQSQNPQVKEFAQMMVRDHQQLVQQLQQVAGKQGQSARGAGATGTSRATEESPNANDASDTTSDARDSDAGGTATIGATDPLSDRSDSDTLGTSSGAATGRVGSSARTTGTDTATGRSLAGTADAGGSGAIQQLMQIDKQIVERQTQATRQELEQQQGADFDKCFLGIAMNAHVHMNAALEVIGQQDLGQVSQLAQQAQPKVQQHLEHAKQLMEQLEGASDNAGRPRSARQPSDTDSQR